MRGGSWLQTAHIFIPDWGLCVFHLTTCKGAHANTGRRENKPIAFDCSLKSCVALPFYSDMVHNRILTEHSHICWQNVHLALQAWLDKREYRLHSESRTGCHSNSSQTWIWVMVGRVLSQCFWVRGPWTTLNSLQGSSVRQGSSIARHSFHS